MADQGCPTTRKDEIELCSCPCFKNDFLLILGHAHSKNNAHWRRKQIICYAENLK
jgi:hypothetical protein